jgi:GT2 family glycosyltransferase
MAGKLDAIVVVYQRTQFLAPLASELARSIRAQGGRLVIVDNGNSEIPRSEISEVAAEENALLVRIDANVNYGAALNRAMIETSAPLVLIAHSDVLPASGCVEAMLAEMSDGRDAVMPYTNSSHIGGAAAPLEDGRPYQLMKTAAVRSKTIAASLAADVLRSAKVPRRGCTVDSVDTFFLLVRREVLDTLGRFNEKVFHRDARMDTLWWAQAGRGRFRSVVAPGAFCFHYGGLTLASLFEDIRVPVRTNDLILADAASGADVGRADDDDVDALRNCVLRFDVEVDRAAPGPVFGMAIHLLHVGQMDAAFADWHGGMFESCTTLAPEADAGECDEAVRNCREPWIMVLKAGETLHGAALAGIKSVTNEPYDAVEFPFMYCSTDGKCLLSREGGARYPFGEVRLFRRDSECRVLPGGQVQCRDGIAVRRCAQLSGDAVLQHIFHVVGWSGKWLDLAPRHLPSPMSGEPASLPSVAVPAAASDRLSVAIGVPTLDLAKPAHRSSRMASCGFRDAISRHPNVETVDCYDGEWMGRVAKNDRVYASGERHQVYISVDEMRSAPRIENCAKMCWITTARFADDVTPDHVASLGYDKYFVSSHSFCGELRAAGCDCDFLPPSVSADSQRQFTRISSRCQVGMLLRARPSDWDPALLEVLSRLRDMECRVFGHGWDDRGRMRSEIAEMPRQDRSKLLAVIDEVVPLLGQPAPAGQENIMYSGMRCLLHVPSPQDARWGFVPHSACESLAAGTPVVVLDRNGMLDAEDFRDAPVYLERTATDAAQRAADTASMSFDDLSILSEQARCWAARNTHDHRAASILASVAVYPGERPELSRGQLIVECTPLSDRLRDRIRFQARLQGMDGVEFKDAESEIVGEFRAEFRNGGSVVVAKWPGSPSASQLDGVIASLG